MKTSFLICVAIFLCAEKNFSAQAPSTKDVFPLSIGNSWKYSYQFLNSDIGNSDGSNQRDSGTISFVVMDSSSTIDTVLWKIQNQRTITRTLQDIQALMVSHETTFVVIDSSILRTLAKFGFDLNRYVSLLLNP